MSGLVYPFLGNGTAVMAWKGAKGGLGCWMILCPS